MSQGSIVTRNEIDRSDALMNPTYGFKGQVAVVTGGSSGMGLATAQAFAEAGAAVVLADINEEKLEGLGRVLAGGQLADVIDDDEIGTADAGHYSLDRGVDLGPAHGRGEGLQREPGHAHALVDDGGAQCLADGSCRCRWVQR